METIKRNRGLIWKKKATRREILNLSCREARDIVYGDSENFKVIEDEITSQGRWCTYHYVIVQRRSDGKFFSSSYSTGSTESQDDHGPYDYDDTAFKEVFPTKVEVIQYL